MKRLKSLDTLRGFDMLWIMGGAGIVTGLCALCGCGDGWLAHQMRHVDWIGLAHHDTIFPLFLFLAGVSWPFSLAAQREKGRTMGQIQREKGRTMGHIQRKILQRTLTLFLLGLSFGGILSGNANWRLMSVLGFIGLSWGLAAEAYLFLDRQWKRGILIAALLGGYWIVSRFFGVAPDAPATELVNGVETAVGPYSFKWNIPMYLDRMFWPNHMLCPGHEPESLFAVTNGMALALAGMCGGFVLKGGCCSPLRKAAYLAIAAAACLLFTLVSVFLLGDPIIKKLWTTSFILAAATYSYAMLALFYFVIDVLGWNKWCVIFEPVGKNSILVYTLSMVGVTSCIHNFLFKGLVGACGDWKGFVGNLLFWLITWSVAYYCQKKDVFIRA